MKAARALAAHGRRAGGSPFAGNHDVLRRLLIAFVLVFALQPFIVAGQPEHPPRPTSHLGGLSEAEVMDLFMPGYEEPPAPSQDPQAEPEWNVTRARVVEGIVTDFGLRKGRYLLAIVNGTRGACAQCGFTIVGIIDLARSCRVWKVEPDHYGGAALELLRLYDGDPQLSFAFRWDSGSHEHNTYQRRAIYRPRLTKAGGLECDLIWSDLIESGAGMGAWGGMWHERCASMAPATRSGEWTYIRRSLFGLPAEAESAEPNEDESDLPETLRCEDRGGPTEIRRTERWAVQKGSGRMSRLSLQTNRIDHADSSTFPFSLPVRSGAWVRSEGGSVEPVPGETGVRSPTRTLRARRAVATSFTDEVAIELGGGQAARTLRGWHTEHFEGTPEALGWAEDGSRFFIVVTFEDERALLSFSVEGTDDFWEELLDPYDTSWHDGFVMQPRSKRPN